MDLKYFPAVMESLLIFLLFHLPKLFFGSNLKEKNNFIKRKKIWGFKFRLQIRAFFVKLLG